MTSLTIVRRIAARPTIVFDCLVTAEGIAGWWGPDSGPVLAAHSDARVGGAYLVRFQAEDGRVHEARGEYLEMDKPRRVVMSFRWAFGGEPDEGGNVSRVTMELRAVNDGTELTFTHMDLATEVSKASHDMGWRGALDKLARRLG